MLMKPYSLAPFTLKSEDCAYHVARLFQLAYEGKTQARQTSVGYFTHGIYGYTEHERLLELFQPEMEQFWSCQLYPTYAYARIYQKGERLEAHVDRPACEYSLTLTLGYSGVPWPFFVALDPERDKESVNLEPGQILTYKGLEVTHWRKPLEGDWHCQMFLHYVAANGPHAEWRFDKRRGLARHF